jgi:hypothetical protein
LPTPPLPDPTAITLRMRGKGVSSPCGACASMRCCSFQARERQAFGGDEPATASRKPSRQRWAG